jgi:hypothetical protein
LRYCIKLAVSALSTGSARHQDTYQAFRAFEILVAANQPTYIVCVERSGHGGSSQESDDESERLHFSKMELSHLNDGV